jgi:hypothetical protein
MYFSRDSLSAPEHDLILKTIGAAYRRSHEGMSALNRGRPLPRLQNLAQLSFRPRYPLQNIAEMSARAFRIGNRSSGGVGVIRIAEFMFDCKIQIAQFVVGAQKTAEDDNGLKREWFVWIGIILLNSGKQSDQRVLTRLPPDFAGLQREPVTQP